jgi:phage shock protein A
MCVVCKKLKTEELNPEDLRDLLEEVSSKISEDHYEEVEEKILEYEEEFDYKAETEDYFQRNVLEEEYGDELDGFRILDDYEEHDKYED